MKSTGATHVDAVTDYVPIKIHCQSEPRKQERLGADVRSKDAEQMNFTYDRTKTVTGKSVPSCCQRIFVIKSVLTDQFIHRQIMQVKYADVILLQLWFLWILCEREDCLNYKRW